MSPTVISLIGLVVLPLLQKAGLQIGSDQFTTFLEVGASIVLLIVGWVRHISLKK